VYALTRNELTLVLQGAYTHLFTWLTRLPGNEIDQISAARLIMVVLLILTAYLVWRLARLWLKGLAAVLPPFVYLSLMPVLENGGSFRADSLLAPLSIGALLALLGPRHGRRGDWTAGVLLGVAFAATVKVILFGPLFLAAVVFRQPTRKGASEWREVGGTLFRVSVAAGVIALVLVGLHWLSITATTTGSITDLAAASAQKTILQPPWFPRIDFFLRYIRWQPFPWLMIGAGAAIALIRRRFDIAALALSLLPLVFYRNAFPYYYVVMLAPASVLAGYAVAEIWVWVRPLGNALVTTAVVSVLWLGFVVQAVQMATLLAFDDQSFQREIVNGVHEIFPQPVNYIDRCGMISSFRKVNFFMSTWGVEEYRARNEPFMTKALRDQQPAFVLWNTPALTPRNDGRYGLLAEDRELLAKYYLQYWGPIWIAGAHGRLESDSLTVTLPFPGDYRLKVSEPVLVNGELRRNGDVIGVPEGPVVVARSGAGSGEPVPVAFMLASANPVPPPEPEFHEIFRGL